MTNVIMSGMPFLLPGGAFFGLNLVKIQTYSEMSLVKLIFVSVAVVLTIVCLRVSISDWSIVMVVLQELYSSSEAPPVINFIYTSVCIASISRSADKSRF